MIKAIHIFSFVFLLAACLGSTSVLAEQLVIPGTGASEVILRELAAAFNAENPGSEVIIPPSVDSSGGIRLVGTGKYDLGRVARSFEKSEMEYRLHYLKFAKDMVVFAVGQKTGIDNLSSQQLAEVFSGKITNWQEVGGNNLPVKLLVKDPEDFSREVILQHLDSFKDITYSRKAKVVFHEYEVVNGLNKYISVIGWLSSSTMKLVGPSVKPVAIDNVAPTVQNLYDGKYVLAFNHALVYKEGRLGGLAKKFVEFIFSKKGNRILVSAGLVPVIDQYN